jgi:hypothetical protein
MAGSAGTAPGTSGVFVAITRSAGPSVGRFRLRFRRRRWSEEWRAQSEPHTHTCSVQLRNGGTVPRVATNCANATRSNFPKSRKNRANNRSRNCCGVSAGPFKSSIGRSLKRSGSAPFRLNHWSSTGTSERSLMRPRPIPSSQHCPAQAARLANPNPCRMGRPRRCMGAKIQTTHKRRKDSRGEEF